MGVVFRGRNGVWDGVAINPFSLSLPALCTRGRQIFVLSRTVMCFCSLWPNSFQERRRYSEYRCAHPLHPQRLSFLHCLIGSYSGSVLRPRLFFLRLPFDSIHLCHCVIRLLLKQIRADVYVFVRVLAHVHVHVYTQLRVPTPPPRINPDRSDE